jgi:hypothetical protein
MYAPPGGPYAPQPPPQYLYEKPGPPGWLVTIGVAVVFSLLGGGFYYWVSHRDAARSEARQAGEVEPARAGKDGEKGSGPKNKLLKYVEVAGVRVVEESKKPQLRVMLVNHSAAELAGLSGTVVVTASGGADAVATLDFTLASLAPYEAKEISGPLKTKLRAYEMPDWQFLKATLELKGSE